jgi:DNA polymerase III sliding clamp (beta) subunit (PCNA family)
MLNRNNLSVSEFTSHEDERRYSMGSVYVKPTETIATNGHYLCRVTTLAPSENAQTAGELKEFTPFLLGAKQAAEIRKAIGKDENVIICANGGEGSYTIKRNDGSTFHAPEIKGTFPNVDAVMPKDDDKPVFEIGFSAAYAAQIAKAFLQFTEKPHHTVKVSLYGKDRPAKLEATSASGQKMTVLLMPIRLEEGKK